MYENPEIGYQEHQSSARLAAFLEEHGFNVDHPTHGLDTAFAATVGTSGPRVVICCEYDALPDIGHACGHNIIATAAVGAGVALAGLADELGIRVTVLGTPAEEGGGGKVDLIDAGALSDAAAAMMIHPSPDDLLDPSFQARSSPMPPSLPMWASTRSTASSRLT
jgi:metal-dependent amidase/aminoacylase/carboxypeptidase family protein